jgi:sporulation protein YlmC with PRC-barrel domain
MIDQASVPSLMGSTVRDSAGEKIGKVGQVYLDDTTGQPEWVTVRTGLFGTKESFVPLAAARVEGDELVVDIPKAKVHDAPRIDEDGHLSEEQETELYTYYGVSQGPFGRQVTPTAGGAPEEGGIDEGGIDEGRVRDTYAGTETGRTGEGYPEADAGADYATGTAAGTAAAAPRFDDTGTPVGERDVAAGYGPGAGGLAGDPTGTPVGDQDVAAAMSGGGFAETDAVTGEEVGPDFARGEDQTVTPAGGGTTGGPDFARGEDASVTGPGSARGSDFARGTDRASQPVAGYGTDADAERAATAGVAGQEYDTDAVPTATGDVAGPGEQAGGVEEPGAARRRLRRWLATEEESSTPVVDESGTVIGEVRTERVDVRPIDEDETR